MCGRFACSEIPKPLAKAFGLSVPVNLGTQYRFLLHKPTFSEELVLCPRI